MADNSSKIVGRSRACPITATPATLTTTCQRHNTTSMMRMRSWRHSGLLLLLVGCQILANSAIVMSAAYINYHHIFERLNLYMRIGGVDLRTREKYPPSPLAIFWVSLISGVAGSFVYTCLVADTETVWRCCSVNPILAQGLIKFYVTIRHLRMFAEVLGRLRRIYQLNQPAGSSPDSCAELLRWSGRMRFVVVNGWMPISFTGLIMLAMPVYTYVRQGTLELVLELWLPGVPVKTPTGYAVHAVYHTLCVVITIAGTCGCDLLMFTLAVHLLPMGGIWKSMWRQLNGALGVPGRRAAAARRVLFRHMLDVHRDITEMMRDMSEVYYPVTFIEVFTDSAMMCISLYAFLVLKWTQAQVWIVMVMIKLLLFCLIGTLIEVAGDRVYDTLLQTRWYEMPVDEQRILVAVLSASQRPRLLMAGTVRLTVITFIETLKTVWSVGMLLVSSQE